VRNTPVAVYLGSAALVVGGLGLALSSPATPPVATSAPVAAAVAPGPVAAEIWPPAQSAVAFQGEIVELLRFESATAQKLAQEAYAKAVARHETAPPREVVREAPPKRRNATRKRPRNDDETIEIVIRDGNAYRTARVPRERLDDLRQGRERLDDLRDLRQGYQPEERSFWRRW
jgi:hypothetical protein